MLIAKLLEGRVSDQKIANIQVIVFLWWPSLMKNLQTEPENIAH